MEIALSTWFLRNHDGHLPTLTHPVVEDPRSGLWFTVSNIFFDGEVRSVRILERMDLTSSAELRGNRSLAACCRHRSFLPDYYRIWKAKMVSSSPKLDLI
ncbi:hypothetical protein CC2G_000289 [Coprinopsis cinerea AmutBmut pab1-1]|nr:hypothetical protein CC2G_000289 [Coprinopsis cinerea AmutBmut pab1-1]